MPTSIRENFADDELKPINQSDIKIRIENVRDGKNQSVPIPENIDQTFILLKRYKKSAFEYKLKCYLYSEKINDSYNLVPYDFFSNFKQDHKFDIIITLYDKKNEIANIRYEHCRFLITKGLKENIWNQKLSDLTGTNKLTMDIIFRCETVKIEKK